MSNEEVVDVIETFTKKYGDVFTDPELMRILENTGHKCRIKGKSDDYFPLLLETELHESLARKAINQVGRGLCRNL
jgi:hypothetical protein